MLVRNFTMSVSALLAIASAAPATAENKPAELPKAERILFWSPTEQARAYPHLDQIFPTRRVARGTVVKSLPDLKKTLSVAFDYDHRPYTLVDFMDVNRTAGVLVIIDGKVALERYALGYSNQQVWPNFSVTKSITSTLVGAAIKDGKIRSIDDQLTEYLPSLRGTAYDGVSIRQTLMMSSGVEWVEDYNDPGSDRAVLGFLAGDKLIAAMAKKLRVSAPGSTFLYRTADTGILGAVVTAATGRNLSDYLSEKIWKPYGMEADANWILSGGQEVAGTCFSARLRDIGRFGMFILDQGKAGSRQVLPTGWIADATRGHLATHYDGTRYGYQWWAHDDGTFEAVGIMGQSMLVDPRNKTIIVIQSAWTNAGTDEQYRLQRAFQLAVQKAVRDGSFTK